MEKFDVTILGCGAALPTPRRLGSAQVVNVREKLFLLDCSEGVQMALRRSKMRFSHLNAIFLTHLHGDHCFGLIGLLSTLGLLGRIADLHIFGPVDMKKIFQPQIEYFCTDSPYNIILHEINVRQSEVVYDDRSATIRTIPLQHRVPCCGYLVQEKPRLPHIRRDAIDAFGIPLSQINNIKAGQDYVMPDGEVIANHLLTFPAEPPRSYAYITDTEFCPSIVPHLQGIDLLYHEATFANEHELLASKTHHSTAAQAAEIARQAYVKQLVIGHFSSRYNNEKGLLAEAQAVFPNTILSNDGMTISL